MQLSSLLRPVLALAIASALGTAHANLVVNGNFETGNFTGWTKSGNTSLSDVISNTVTSNHTYVWRSGATGSEAFISQNIATTAGSTYDLEFDVFNTATTNSVFEVLFGGVKVFGFSNEIHDWTHYQFDVLATSSLTELKFGARNDPSFTRLDNVTLDLVNAAAVPEPTSIALVGVALFAAGAARLRSRSTR